MSGKIPVTPPASPPTDPSNIHMPTSPERDSAFMILPGGKDLSRIQVSDSSLYLVKGNGTAFGSSAKAAYKKLKEESQSIHNYKVQWAFMDLDKGEIIAQSRSSDKRIFGASSSKVFVAATLLDLKEGELSSSQLQQMADMIVVSSNTAWTNLQSIIGNGSSDLGRQRNYEFTQRMGYSKTHGFQGWWSNLHGNELTAADTVQFLYDTYHGKYTGAETLWKLMYTSRTGSSKAKKYLPSTLYVGGKTGTYDGSTYDSDLEQNVSVKVRNHLIVFYANGRQYGLMVLANTGSEESSALLAGGLYREFILGEIL